jgi:hypothetical protein
MTLRWRRQSGERGLARHCQGPLGWDIGDREKDTYAQVRYIPGGWYFYGATPRTRINTADSPVATPEEAKGRALAWLKRGLEAKV